jgi:hypothetical protein
MHGRPHHNAGPGECGQIEGVNRLPKAMQHVIRGINHIADTALPDALQALPEPVRAGANLHARDHRREVAWAADLILNTHRSMRADRVRYGMMNRDVGRRGRKVGRHVAQWYAQEGGNLTRYAAVRQEVRTVRQNIQLKLSIGDGQHIQ